MKRFLLGYRVRHWIRWNEDLILFLAVVAVCTALVWLFPEAFQVTFVQPVRRTVSWIISIPAAIWNAIVALVLGLLHLIGKTLFVILEVLVIFGIPTVLGVVYACLLYCRTILSWLAVPLIILITGIMAYQSFGLIVALPWAESTTGILPKDIGLWFAFLPWYVPVFAFFMWAFEDDNKRRSRDW